MISLTPISVTFSKSHSKIFLSNESKHSDVVGSTLSIQNALNEFGILRRELEQTHSAGDKTLFQSHRISISCQKEKAAITSFK